MSNLLKLHGTVGSAFDISGPADWNRIINLTAPFGLDKLELWLTPNEPASQCTIDGRIVAAIAKAGPGKPLVISLKVPSPIPGGPAPYGTDLRVVLQRTAFDQPWWQESAPGQWLEEAGNSAAGLLDGWMDYGPMHRRQNKRDYQFPLGPDGLNLIAGGATLAWMDDRKEFSEFYGQLGIIRAGADLVLAYMPRGDVNVHGSRTSPGLLDIDKLVFGVRSNSGDPMFTQAPLIMTYRLGASIAQESWDLFVQWRAMRNSVDPRPIALSPCLFQHLLDPLWNDTVRAVGAGRRIEQSLAWLPLPTLASVSPTKAHALIALERKPQARTTRAVNVLAAGPQPERLRLDCPFLGIAVSGTLEGGAELKSWHDAMDIHTLPVQTLAAADVRSLCEKRRASGTDAASIADWTIKLDRIELPGPARTVVLGSMELRFAPTGEATDVIGSARCQLHGVWTLDERQLHPEFALSLPCQFRASGAGDQGQQARAARFDTTSEFEDQLQRGSGPLMFQGADSSWRGATLKLRYKSQRGLDAVTEMVLESGAGETTLDASSLYIQLRPFMVARMHPVQFDPQAGSRIAEWRSDDRDGPQWRLADATVDLELPPQAVGEEMERGSRFWPACGAAFRPGAPLRYRFSPPTRLLVRPSALRARRYNISPYNLMDVLRHAKVEQFTTEVVYPVRTTFTVDLGGAPDIRIAETGALIGQPAPNLPSAPDQHDELDSTLLGDLYDPALAAWASQLTPAQRANLLAAYRVLRQRHSAARMNVVARLAEHHLYDPWRRDGKLMLREGMQSVLRGTAMGAPPLLESVLPNGSKLSERARRGLAGFLQDDNGWGALKEGALSAGALYTMEFASELLAVLRTPVATETVIEHLSFTALGANAHFAVSFDEGRTTFTVDVRHGQVARLVKTRIGRIALLWNTAKHVIIYQRDVVPSTQFKDEQNAKPHTGWPILRKWEEFIEPVERVRKFGADKQKDHHVAGFVDGAEFITPRIHVNGAWGRDLRNEEDVEFGYEIPLWNAVDTSGFYPAPSAALLVVADPAVINRAPIKDPQHLYFYSNTETGTGNDPDRWEAKDRVDGDSRLARLPAMTGHADTIADPRTDASLSPRPGAFSRPRFDLAVLPVVAANLQHQRGAEQILAKLNVISLSRIDVTETIGIESVKQVLALPMQIDQASSRVASIEEKLRRLLDRLPAMARDVHRGCETVKARMLAELDRGFAELADGIDALPTPGLAAMLAQVTTTAFAQLSATLQRELNDRLSAPLRTLSDLDRLVLAAIDDALAVPLAELAQEKARLLHAIALNLSAIRVVVTKARNDTAQFQTDLQANSLAALHAAITTVRDEFSKVTATFDGWDINTELAALAADARAKIDSVNGAIDATLAGIDKLLSIPTPALPGCGRPAATAAMELMRTTRTALAEVARQLEQVRRDIPNHADVAALRAMLQATFLDAKGTLTVVIKRCHAQFGKAAAVLDAMLTEGLDRLARALATANGQASALVTRLEEEENRLQEAADDGETQLRAALHQLRGTIALAAGEVGVQLSALIDSYSKQLAAAFESGGAFKAALEDLTASALDMATMADAYMKRLDIGGKKRGMTAWLAEQYGAARQGIDNLDCAALDQLAAVVRAQLEHVINDVKERVTGVLTSALDDTTRHQFQEIAAGAASATAAMGKGIKLVKAIGELPALPTLTFNAERAEYVFDDLKKQIETSPFVARLREVGDGLQDLGLSLPSNSLLDQFIPSGLEGKEFSSVFNKIAGMDFADFFERFKLPQIHRNDIKLLHGIDQASRSAWVKTAVNTRFAGENELLNIGPMAIKVNDMLIDAHSNTRISLSGERQGDTDAKLTGDWALEFGGTMLARFKQVTISYDGSGFGFDVSPANIELHPALKFISEFAKRFSDNLPPAIEIERDKRGMPVGARSSIVTEIKDLPPLGPVTIGPLRIAAGMGLRVAQNGKFVVSTHVAVGSRSTPVFVQISYLGGGMYLEARAEAAGGDISYAATVGLALGSMRALNFASIARGHYSILLFASADIDNRGGTFRAGLSFDGAARILGMCNASISVLLEAVHSEGKTEGHGELHVEVEICWCYTLRVHRAVTQKI